MAKPTTKRVRSTRPTPRPLAVRKVSLPARATAASLGSATIVGIGASAGGLEAARSLLQHLSLTTGLAYVVVQHLAPRHESVLPELLNASSSLPVVQATEGMPLMPNRVHVIPPNTVMTVQDGRLHLAQRPTDQVAVLADRHIFLEPRRVCRRARGGHRALRLRVRRIDGLKDIKAVGGITIAQEPKSAKYDGMPRAAIATGAVDLVLTPEQIAHEFDPRRQPPIRLRSSPPRASRQRLHRAAAQTAVCSASRCQRGGLHSLQAADDQAPPAAPDGAATRRRTSTEYLTLPRRRTPTRSRTCIATS